MIYFVRQGDSGPIKIGYSRTVRGARKRVASMQTAHAVDLRLGSVVSGDRDDEQLLHSYFRERRVRGEWFDPCDAIEACWLSGLHATTLLDGIQCQQRWAGWGLDVGGDDATVAYVSELERHVLEHGGEVEEYGLRLKRFIREYARA